jgi:hypothetical protein
MSGYKDCYGDEVVRIFTDLFLSDKPLWIARYGGSDTFAYEVFKNTNKLSKESVNCVSKFNGFFCKNKNTILNVFAESTKDYYDSLQNSDFITIIGGENEVNNFINHNNSFIHKHISTYSFIEAFEPFFKSFKIWGENKKILIISPFSKTIKYQTSAERINKILTHHTFPNCSFITYQTPITYNTDDFTSNYFKTETNGYNNWLELSNKMCNEIKDLDFDVAFISAGIYTMNIGNFIKKNGKKAIYIGGMLNVLFNIYGSRYDTSFFNNFMNKEYQVDVMDSFDDLTNNNSLYVKNEALGAYMRNKCI